MLTCKQTWEALLTLNTDLTHKLIKLTMLELQAVTTAMTGRGPFNKPFFYQGFTDSPLCRVCTARVCPTESHYESSFVFRVKS